MLRSKTKEETTYCQTDILNSENVRDTLKRILVALAQNEPVSIKLVDASHGGPEDKVPV